MTHDSDPTTRLTVAGPDGDVHDLPSTEAQAVIDAWTAAEAESARWRDDGHTAAVRLQDRTLVADIRCPHDGRDLTALPTDRAPACRRSPDEYDDNGERVGPGPLLDECVLTEIAKSWQNDELWATDTTDLEAPRSPFPVLWRGRDQYDIEIKPKPVGEQPKDAGPREWGHRYWDGSAGPDESRDAALELAARFKPGAVELVHRAGPDAPWVRAGYQPHVPSERLDLLAGYAADLNRLNDWRGHRLVEVGEYPNPPLDWEPTTQSGSIAAPEGLFEATCAPHTLTVGDGGVWQRVAHPAACDRLPYGRQCAHDLAYGLGGYEQEPPTAPGAYTVTPYVAHDHGDGDCVRRDCPVLIRWSSAEDRSEVAR